MSKKYTIKLYSDGRIERSKNITLGRKSIITASLVIFASLFLFSYSIFKFYSLKSEKNILSSLMLENDSLKQQLRQLTTQLDKISSQINELDNFEYKIKSLVNLQKGVHSLKPIAVGGKEVDILRQFSASASMNEKEFFDKFNDALEEYTQEVNSRKLTLSDLAASLEDQKLIMSYTPTLMPVKGWISSNFGYRVSPFSNRQILHEGIDIAAKLGTDVKATASGTVIFADNQAGYGKMIIIDHGHGYITKYGHNLEINVKVGDKVEKGQIISKVGSSGLSTGPHLHYEVHVNGIPVNPLKFIIDDSII